VSHRALATYMTDKVGPLPFCPGCGHTVLIKALDKALVKLAPDPKQVVIVTDIGCIGLADHHFITNAFHGLHGRSITYACGLKLARPELSVITLMGDGACGIGGTHLLNVARRNIGITLLVANNLNYGMTGGQHSVTTPTGGMTSTTPWGNIERPMDLCGTAVAAGAAWVHRATSFDGDLPDILATAIDQPGFAMVEVWELCTAHYVPRNKFGKKDLIALRQSLGFEHGPLVDRMRPEYTEWHREAFERSRGQAPPPPTIETCYSNRVSRKTGIVIAGSAGQKIRSTATAFAKAAMYTGLNATQKDDYPITVLTGFSVSELILSPETIEYTAIESPDYVILLSADGVKRVRAKIGQLAASCTIYADAALELPETEARVVRLPLEAVSKVTTATAALTAMLTHTELFQHEAFEKAFRVFKSPSIAEQNLKAMAEGTALIDMTRQAGSRGGAE